MKWPGKGIRWKKFLTSLYGEWDRDNVTDYSGALAYSAVLAIFPFLLFVVSLASLVVDPTAVESTVRSFARVAPAAARDILQTEVHRLLQGKPALLTISIVGAIYAASGGVSAMMRALNTMYDVDDSRPFWKVQGIALLTTILGAIGAIVASAVALVTPAVAHAIGGPVATVILWLRFPVAAVVVMFVIACLYYFLPDVEQKFKFITPGSVFAVVAWLLASIGFSVYASNFGSYGVTYGALGGVIVFLLWLWISAQAVLIGAEINAILEAASPEGKRVGKRTFAKGDVGSDLPKSEKADVREIEIAEEHARARGEAHARKGKRLQPGVEVPVATNARPGALVRPLASRAPDRLVRAPERVVVARRSPAAVAGAVLAALGLGVVLGRKAR
jgi:membrane protein